MKTALEYMILVFAVGTLFSLVVLAIGNVRGAVVLLSFRTPPQQKKSRLRTVERFRTQASVTFLISILLLVLFAFIRSKYL